VTPPDFTETDPVVIESAVLTDYEGRASRTLFDGDFVRLILETMAYALARQRAEIQGAAEQNLIQFATGENLEFLAELYGLSRRPAQPAVTTLQFATDGSPAANDITIPKGTKVATEDGSVRFATDEEVVLSSGDTSVQVDATATEPGAQANGLIAGQVSEIVNPISGIASAVNTTETIDGADQESDEALRKRVRAAPETFAVAGPKGAYRQVARTARRDVTDVTVFQSAPGEVTVVPLLEEGRAPNTSQLQDVTMALSAADQRPLTDRVSVQAPTTVSYDIDLSYVIYESEQSRKEQIDAGVEAAADRYLRWQRRRLGRDITPDFLAGQVLDVSGIKRITISSPTDTVLHRTEVAQIGTKTLTFAGFETE
jgi:phage-related baseplate assembly protein